MEATASKTRLVGAHVDGPGLERQLAARSMEAEELVKLTGLARDTVTRARQGGRLSRDSLRRIHEVLERTPVDPLLAALVGLEVPKDGER